MPQIPLQAAKISNATFSLHFYAHFPGSRGITKIKLYNVNTIKTGIS